MVAVLSLSSCSSPTSAYESAKTQPFGPCGSTYAELVAKAQQEGALILIGTPRGSAGSRAVIEDFTRRYDIDVSTILEDSSSADELTIIRTWKGDPRYPDVIDVSSAALEAAIREGLLADYRVQAYATIDDRFKRPDGFQVANYFGLMGFGVNTSKVDHVPQTWADLEKPEYRRAIALNGDPRESGAGIQAIAAAALANGGSYDNILPGIDYFARLRKSGNLQLNQVNNTDVLDGGIPIAIDWNYNFPPLERKFAKEGIEFATVIPSDGIGQGVYFQGLVADANHPCAARLWLDHLVSDDVALSRLRAGAIPARYASVRSSLNSSEQTYVPPNTEIEASLAPTAEQFLRMQEVVNERWVPLVVNGEPE